MAELTVNTIDREGGTADIDSLLVDAGNAGDTFDGAGKAFLVVYNGSAGMRTVTPLFSESVDVDGQTTAGGGILNKTVDVDVGKYAFIGPFTQDYLDDDGMVSVEYDDVAGVLVGAFVLTTEGTQ